MRPVGLGRVEEGDAPVEGRPDDVDHLRPVRHRRLVLAAHVLDAQPDAETSSVPSFLRSFTVAALPGVVSAAPLAE